MINKIIDNIYRIKVPLPNSPLKNLNSYVIKSSDRNLIVDTGFNMPECYKALTAGLCELDIDMSRTDIFITHAHTDHGGLAPAIASKDTRIIMSETDAVLNSGFRDHTFYWTSMEELYASEGFGREDIVRLRDINPARVLGSDKPINYNIVSDGDKVHVGKYKLKCISTPGHSPGHMCLFLEEEKLML